MADSDIKPGDKASWNWGKSSITGTVSLQGGPLGVILPYMSHLTQIVRTHAGDRRVHRPC